MEKNKLIKMYLHFLDIQFSEKLEAVLIMLFSKSLIRIPLLQETRNFSELQEWITYCQLKYQDVWVWQFLND